MSAEFFLDNNGNTIAVLLRSQVNSHESVEFYSNQNEEFQLALMKKKPFEIIQRHFHPLQPRTIMHTSEAIIMREGELEVELYDDQRVILVKVILKAQDILILLEGGHGFRSLDSGSVFVEIKQGPYDEGKDKVHF